MDGDHEDTANEDDGKPIHSTCTIFDKQFFIHNGNAVDNIINIDI